MTVSLPTQIEALIRTKIESGEYPDAGAVVAEALRLLEVRDDAAATERWRAAVQVGIDRTARGAIGGLPLTP